MLFYSRGRVAAAIVLILAIAYLPTAPGESSAGGHNRSATAAASAGPPRTALHNSKYVARQAFKTPCRRVHVEVRKQTPDPRFVGQAVHPCSVVIRRGEYTFHKICALMVHEYGHLAGFEHSTDPNDIMHPARPQRYPPCVRHQALMQRRGTRR